MVNKGNLAWLGLAWLGLTFGWTIPH